MKMMIVLAFLALPLYSQLPDETKGRIPELDAFHKPIYAIWHEAWPAKDIQTLKQLFPQVDTAYAKLAAAVLPGILRDKQIKWDEKKGELRTAVEEYRMSITGNDTMRILKAAENVHMLYEHMIRIVRPVTKEIDEFHRALYSIHHYYIPEKNMEMIKKSAEDLSAAMAVIDTVKLPAKWEKKKEMYEKRRTLLSESVKAYVSEVRAAKAFDLLTKSEGIVHSRYQMLEKMFE
jgi:hypothetical protein